MLDRIVVFIYNRINKNARGGNAMNTTITVNAPTQEEAERISLNIMAQYPGATIRISWDNMTDPGPDFTPRPWR